MKLYSFNNFQLQSFVFLKIFQKHCFFKKCPKNLKIFGKFKFFCISCCNFIGLFNGTQTSKSNGPIAVFMSKMAFLKSKFKDDSVRVQRRTVPHFKGLFKTFKMRYITSLYSDGIIFKIRFQKSRFIEEIGKVSGYFLGGVYHFLACSEHRHKVKDF